MCLNSGLSEDCDVGILGLLYYYYVPNNGWKQFSTVQVATAEGGGKEAFTDHSKRGAYDLVICTGNKLSFFIVISTTFRRL